MKGRDVVRKPDGFLVCRAEGRDGSHVFQQRIPCEQLAFRGEVAR